MTQKIWFLYRITNKINNKIYIGQAQNYKHRWTDHKLAVKNGRPTQIIHHAMIKYGLDNFDFEVIACCRSLEDTNDTETELVKQYDSFVKNDKGYNATLGGMNAPKTEEWKQKMSIKFKGRIIDEVWKIKMRKPHNMTPEGLAKILAANKLRPAPNQGFTTSDQRAKISVTLLKKYASGEKVTWNKGLTGVQQHSPETIEKMKIAANKPENIKANSDRRKKYWEEHPDFAPNKGMLTGEKHHQAKLTEKQVLEIREKYALGIYSHKDLAIEYGCKAPTIGDIIKRRTWKHI